MKQFDEMFTSHIEIHTVGKVTPINVKQKNKYDPYRFTAVSTAVWSCVVCL